MIKLSRRDFGLLAAATATLPLKAVAQSFPTKPIQLHIPFAAGGSTDILARIMGPELGRELKTTIVVSNRAGANGSIAAAALKALPPDGYAIMLATNSPLSAAPHIYRTTGYDPVKDFTPILGIGTLPFVVLVNPQLKARSVGELIALANSSANGLNYGSGSTVALATGESIRAMGKARLVNVNYKSGPQALLDTIGGQLNFVVSDLASSTPHIESGALIPIAVPTAKRSKLFPSLPSISETPAMQGFDLTSWYGMVGPAGMPPEIVREIARATEATMGHAAVQKRAQELSFDIEIQPTADFQQYVRHQLDHWGRVLKTANIQPEG